MKKLLHACAFCEAGAPRSSLVSFSKASLAAIADASRERPQDCTPNGRRRPIDVRFDAASNLSRTE
jgi:hypothetical protein